MNTKTYNFVKYIATLGALLLFLAPLLGFLQEWSYIQPDHFNNSYVFKSPVALVLTTWILEIVGLVLVVVYSFIRNRLKAKSGYVYTKKDNLKLNLAYGFYFANMLVSFIYVIISTVKGFPTSDGKVIANGTKIEKTFGDYNYIVAIMITFAPFYVMQFAFSICAAIFESMSRIQEQIYLYNQVEDEKNKNSSAVSKSGTKRTKEAQALLADEDKTKKKSSTTKKHKSEEYIDDEKTLEDFFHEDDDEKDN